MSRQAATKSRADKTASRGGGTQSVTAPNVVNEIIPGRLTEAEWSRLMFEDDETNYISTVIEDILDTALEECYKKYIWSQVLPFTVHQAKDAILQIVQWHFLSRDVGETNIADDPGWKEDSEPEAGVIDSWAQGSVPVVVRPQSSSVPSISMISEEQPFLQAQTRHAHIADESVVSGTEPTTIVSDEHTDSTGKSGENENVPEPEQPTLDPTLDISDSGYTQEPSKEPKKKKRSYKRHTGRVLPPNIPDYDKLEIKEDSPQAKEEETESKLDTHLSPSQKTLIKVQAGRPPGNREVTFDQYGNVIGVMKLNPLTLPTHRVRVQYAIIDPEAEANAQKITALRTGRVQKSIKSVKTSRRDEASYVSNKSLDTRKDAVRSRGKSGTSSSYRTRDLAMTVQQFPPGQAAVHRSQRIPRSYVRERRVHGARIDPLPPLLIETIDASPGVIIQEGEHVKKGPEEKYPVGINRVLDKPNIVSATQQPVFRLLSNKRITSKLRPSIDPKDVVQDVKDSTGKILFAVSSPLPTPGHTQTTES